MPDTNKSTNALKEVVAIKYITKDNAKFKVVNDFVSMTVTLPDDDGNMTEKTYDRIFLHRAFPFDFPYAYISVLDSDSAEIVSPRKRRQRTQSRSSETVISSARSASSRKYDASRG